MKTNVLCLLKNMDKKDVELQLALQCAPVITGIKVSNLFIIDKNKVDEVYNIIDETDISAYFLYEDAAKANILLYRKNELQQYLFQKENRQFVNLVMTAFILMNCCRNLQYDFLCIRLFRRIFHMRWEYY